jgi:hypothetical protein
MDNATAYDEERRYMTAATYVISVGVADVRREPDSTSELVTQALLNAAVIPDQVQGAWTHVTLTDYEGWIQSDELDEPPVKGFCKVGPCCATSLSLVAVVTVPHTPLYAEAEEDTQFDIAYLSTALPLLDTTHAARLQVALPGGRFAWLVRDAAAIRTGNAVYPIKPVTTVTHYARLFLGVPYLWGGTTWRGLDCSGLVQLCYRMSGYLLPRDADQQYAALIQDVPREAMQEGDLIFFGTTSITHVALALNAREYIHAEGNRYGRVLVHSFAPSDTHYDQRLYENFWGIRRVVQDKE